MKQLSFLLILLMTGCSSPYVQVGVGKAAEANDEALSAAHFVVCYGASIGSIRRAYGDKPDVWKAFCSTNENVSVGQ